MSEYEKNISHRKTLSDVPGMRPDGFNMFDASGNLTEFQIDGMNSDEAIRALTHINGVPIEELEQRMYGSTTEGRRGSISSYSGFLGFNEKLLIEILAATHTVLENERTHAELA